MSARPDAGGGAGHFRTAGTFGAHGSAGWRLSAAVLACLLVLGAARTAEAALRIVATLPSLAAIAQEVGGEAVAVVAMAAPSQDPHFVDARPSHVVALSRADLLLANGLELEVGWLPPLQVAARNARVQVGAPGFLEVAQLVDLLEVPQVRIDRAMGDLHTGGNPHFLNEPRRVAQIARGVAVRLGQLEPARAGAFVARAEAFAQRLEALYVRTRAPLLALPAARRRIVAYHKSLAYLLAWLGLEEATVLEPRPGVPPDPRHVAEVLATVRQRGVAAFVQEEYYPTRVAETLYKLTGVPVVVVPGNVRFAQKQSYEAYLEEVARRVTQALLSAPASASAPAARPAPASAPTKVSTPAPTADCVPTRGFTGSNGRAER